jgi:type I restriction enzyme R subunit
MTHFTESVVEEAALTWLAGLGWEVAPGQALVEGLTAERADYGQVVLEGRLRAALSRLNPALPAGALDDAFRKLLHPEGPTLVARNHALHRMLVDGVTVEHRRADGSIAGDRARVLDFDDPTNNDWLAVNQFTVVETAQGAHSGAPGQTTTRRPDVVLFVNGLPLGVIELKNAADENATIWSAYHQLQTYKAQIPSLFEANAALVISDGLTARLGSLTANKEWFLPWRTIGGEEITEAVAELEVLLAGAFEKRRFLDLIRYFTVFEGDGGAPVKKLAGYHQFHAVNVALEETLRAARDPAEAVLRERGSGYMARPQADAAPGDKRVGVVWHTQGSGKSLTMAFYAGRVILHPEMRNPTLVVLTDRNDLDDQLFGVFSRCRELLRQPPVQAQSRAHLRELLRVESGGVVFTTIQKFLFDDVGADLSVRPVDGQPHRIAPTLSDRRNIVVIADEAHRSQYDFVDGYARDMRDSLPNASFVAFTGTPVELTDRNTRAVFGDYISVYDIYRAVQDGATVPIYYEGRLAVLALDEAERPKVDPEFEEVTEGEEVERVEALKSKWAQLEALVGADKRVKLIAEDLVRHYEDRQTAMDGKAMIVCMSRRICVDLYHEIAALRPEWVDPDDAKGALKIVMTGSASDPLEWQTHIRSKARREEMANRFRDPADAFKIVIVRDMWLTGFDAPSLHTMYVDKPMRGHGLMQAIARVNRVFRDKPGGLVVDYLGLADELRQALLVYTQSGGEGQATISQEEAVAAMLRHYEICRGLFHGFDWSRWTSGKAVAQVSLLPRAQEHILAQPDGKDRLLRAVTDLSKAFALAVPHDKALAIRDDVGFFQAVRAALAKTEVDGYKIGEDLDFAVRQIVSKAVASDEVLDIFAAAGLRRPDISILDDAFLAEIEGMPQRNLAVELLRKLLAGEIKTRSKKNVVQARSFLEMLEQAIRRYQNRAIETAQVIEELIALAKEMREATSRGEALGLTEDELAFYDALEVNDSAVKVLGDEVLRAIARELAQTIRKNVTIDWTLRENVRAQMRVYVKRILRRHGYPPDKQEKATQTVIEQAEALSAEWAVS